MGLYNTNEVVMSNEKKIKIGSTKAKMYVNGNEVKVFDEQRNPLRANLRLQPGNYEIELKFNGLIANGKLKSKVSLPSAGEYQLIFKQAALSTKLDLVYGSMFS